MSRESRPSVFQSTGFRNYESGVADGLRSGSMLGFALMLDLRVGPVRGAFEGGSLVSVAPVFSASSVPSSQVRLTIKPLAAVFSRVIASGSSTASDVEVELHVDVFRRGSVPHNRCLR